VKDKFFSIISHDLKNPVQMQNNALQLLSNNINQWDSHILSDYSSQLLKSSDDLVDLLHNLLNWSLMQSGKEVYNPIMFNLPAILQPEINIIKSMAASKNITFDMQAPPTAIVTADENMLKTVVRNLLANAVKFTATGGTVTLEITPQTSNLKPRTPYLISVSDTGVGMSAVETQCIASLQTRSKPGTAGERGTGLGLIVCKEMLAKHGSKLFVESVEGKGSKFWFTV